MKFKHPAILFDLSDKDMERITDEMSTIFMKAKTFEDFAKDSMKIPRNEEEMKFVMFMLGRFDGVNFILNKFKLIENNFKSLEQRLVLTVILEDVIQEGIKYVGIGVR